MVPSWCHLDNSLTGLQVPWPSELSDTLGQWHEFQSFFTVYQMGGQNMGMSQFTECAARQENHWSCKWLCSLGQGWLANTGPDPIDINGTVGVLPLTSLGAGACPRGWHFFSSSLRETPQNLVVPPHGSEDMWEAGCRLLRLGDFVFLLSIRDWVSRETSILG